MGHGLNRRGIVLAALALASPAVAGTCGTDEEFHRQLRGKIIVAQSCGLAVSDELIRSGESPSDITTASLVECKSSIDDVDRFADLCRPYGVAEELKPMLLSGIRNTIIAHIVKKRATRP